jgi:hypothetical protein
VRRRALHLDQPQRPQAPGRRAAGVVDAAGRGVEPTVALAAVGDHDEATRGAPIDAQILEERPDVALVVGVRADPQHPRRRRQRRHRPTRRLELDAGFSDTRADQRRK